MMTTHVDADDYNHSCWWCWWWYDDDDGDDGNEDDDEDDDDDDDGPPVAAVKPLATLHQRFLGENMRTDGWIFVLLSNMIIDYQQLIISMSARIIDW